MAPKKKSKKRASKQKYPKTTPSQSDFSETRSEISDVDSEQKVASIQEEDPSVEQPTSLLSDQQQLENIKEEVNTPRMNATTSTDNAPRMKPTTSTEQLISQSIIGFNPNPETSQLSASIARSMPKTIKKVQTNPPILFEPDHLQTLTEGQVVHKPIPQTIHIPGKPTTSTEQLISQSIGFTNPIITSRSIPKYSNSLSRSMPKSIPKRVAIKIATPTSLFQQSYRKSMLESDSDRDDSLREVDDSIAEHLVQPTEIPGKQSGVSFGSMSHSLVGGAITRDIYKWQEAKQQRDEVRPRRNSEPEIQMLYSPVAPTASALQQPGAFRRQFITNKAKKEGKRPPNFLTSNFIDFLVLYGYFGGDVYPSDDDDSDSEEDRLPGSVPTDLEHQSENAPLLERQSSTNLAAIKGTSQAKAFFMLLKAFVGTGILFLPKAFSNGGILFSSICMVGFGFLTMHCMILLVEASRSFGGKSFGDLGQIIYGEKCRLLILGSIAVSQMGFCCAYLIFVGQNLRDLLMIVSNCDLILPDWFFICLQLLVYIPLAWVRKIKNFGLTSLIADLFILLGLGFIFFYDLVLIGNNGIQEVPWMNLQSFPLFIGTAMFAFEGICLMLPIAESMKEPEKFNNVLINGMITIGFLFISVGGLSFLAFGEKVETIVFLNLPKSPAVTALQFLYAIAIMLSFPLCVYPAIRITEQGLFGHSTGKSSNLVKWQKNFYRTALTLVLGVVAWAGSTNLDKVVSLVGCFCCIPLSFVYPALFHAHVTPSKWVRLKDWMIVVFGTLATFYTTYITLEQWAVGGPNLPLDRCHAEDGSIRELAFFF